MNKSVNLSALTAHGSKIRVGDIYVTAGIDLDDLTYFTKHEGTTPPDSFVVEGLDASVELFLREYDTDDQTYLYMSTDSVPTYDGDRLVAITVYN